MKNDHGFTLLEILIAMAITAIGLVFVTYFTIDLSNFGLTLDTRLENQRELEMTLRTMLSEIRSMGPGENGAYPIATADGTTFTFYTDIDGDGTFEQVRYFLQAGVLKKGITEPTQTEPVQYPPANEAVKDVVHYITSASIFSYYAEGFPGQIASLSSPVDVSAIRLVSVSATTDIDPNKPPTPLTLSIMATIRNLRGDI